MHGAGNDFIVLDAINQNLSAITTEQWRALSHRHFGVGADQILLIEKASNNDADFCYRIFNADGNEVEQCGNGSRCFARYVYEKKLTQKKVIRVEVGQRIITLHIKNNEYIAVDMGVPLFSVEKIPFLADKLQSKLDHQQPIYALTIGHSVLWVAVLSMGNPHAVQIVDDIYRAPVLKEGPLLMQHSAFPQQVNVGYMQIVSRQHILLRVFERGAGETYACGTGACAAVVSGIRRDLLTSPVRVSTRGGELEITWNGSEVWMSGPAKTVFTGEVNLDDLQIDKGSIKNLE